MKTIKKIIRLTLFLSILLCPGLLIAQGNLNGTWKYSAAGAVMMMEINGNTMTIDGVSYTFKAENNNLLVYEGNSYTAYPYSLNGDQLTLTFPGGMKIAFKKEGVEIPAAVNQLPQSMQRPSSGQPATGQEQTLTGRWLFSTQQGELLLEFLSASQLTFNGESTQYQLQPGIIQAMGDNGWINYPYKFSEGKLIITFPDGTQIPFVRNTGAVNQGVANNQVQGGGGPVGSLYGSLCFWSGSSGSYSSYSRTEKIVFDGKGSFVYSKEGSFSSDAGIAYSGNPNANRGTYRLDDRYVYLQFLSGETLKVDIAIRENNGRITAIKYQEKIYSTTLCD